MTQVRKLNLADEALVEMGATYKDLPKMERLGFLQALVPQYMREVLVKTLGTLQHLCRLFLCRL